MRSESDEVVQAIAQALHLDGYLRHDGVMRSSDVMPFFAKMRADAAEGRTMATPANGREAALHFLKATVEDAQKPMAERMEAARMLLMHSAEEKR